MVQIEIRTSEIFKIVKKFFPIYLKYINYFTLLFIAMFISLGLASSIIYLINGNQSWNATISNSNQTGNIVINKGNYHLFLQWLFTNKNAVHIAFAASFFGFSTCLNILIETIVLIKSNKIIIWKLCLFTFAFILFFVSSFMLSFGFNNSSIPIGIGKNNVIETQGPIIDNRVITITGTKIPWTDIKIPGSDPSGTGSEINIPIGLNPTKGNYIYYLASTISISLLGNVLYLVNKVLKKFNIKIVWDGFKSKEENNVVNEISDDLLEIDNENQNNNKNKNVEDNKIETKVDSKKTTNKTK